MQEDQRQTIDKLDILPGISRFSVLRILTEDNKGRSKVPASVPEGP